MAVTPSAAAPQYMRRTTRIDHGATVEVSSLETGSVVLAFNGSVSTVQVAAVMSREQLVAVRDAINSVLVGTEA